MTRQYYLSILGLNAGATKDQIRKQYRKLAMQYHPDKNPNSNAVEKFREITIAYDILSSNNPLLLKSPVAPKRTPEQKWAHVQHPPRNKKDFEEWYQVKSKKAERFDEMTYDEFLKTLDSEEKSKIALSQILFILVPVLFVGMLVFVKPVYNYLYPPNEKGANNSEGVWLVLTFLGVVAVALVVTGSYFKRLDREAKKKYFKELRRRRKQRAKQRS